ncbi:MAG: hypothetical protein H0X39_16820, partial [Actinobacteria bacterium]|nr:hypothetical protein [Actinomycetota bacterium]
MSLQPPSSPLAPGGSQTTGVTVVASLNGVPVPLVLDAAAVAAVAAALDP